MIRRSEWLRLNPRATRETAWVLSHKLIEFVLTFGLLKLMTNLMNRDSFGEYNLAVASLALVTNVALMPMMQAYLRHLPAADAAGRTASVSRQAATWFTVIPLILFAAAAVLSPRLGRWFSIGEWTALATGFVFVGSGWRTLAISALEQRRRRKLGALQNLGFLATQTAMTAALLYVWRDSATVALLAYGVAAGTFGGLGAWFILREACAAGGSPEPELMRVVWRFGVPYAALLICQWVQNFAERFIVGIRLDLDSVGLYVAAYQVCGIPFMLVLSVYQTLLVPIAYQRAKDPHDPVQVWSADRVLLAGLGVYVLFGVVAIAVYALVGPELVRMLTSAHYDVPRSSVLLLALARWLQCLGLALQFIFAVHQKMTASLGSRALCGLLVVPICWYATGWLGINGAAAGVALVGAIFIAILSFGPTGCVRLVQSVRRRASAPPGPACPPK